MATHSSILALRIPWIEEPGGLQFMGLRKIQTWLRFHNKNDVTERDWSTLDKNDLRGDHSRWRIRGTFPQSSCELVKFLTVLGAQGNGGGDPITTMIFAYLVGWGLHVRVNLGVGRFPIRYTLRLEINTCFIHILWKFPQKNPQAPGYQPELCRSAFKMLLPNEKKILTHMAGSIFSGSCSLTASEGKGWDRSIVHFRCMSQR